MGLQDNPDNEEIYMYLIIYQFNLNIFNYPMFNVIVHNAYINEETVLNQVEHRSILKSLLNASILHWPALISLSSVLQVLIVEYYTAVLIPVFFYTWDCAKNNLLMLDNVSCHLLFDSH